jgi:hypothetical protein
MSKSMTVILDIDDVSMPWAAPVHQECVRQGLTDLPSHTQWKMYENYVKNGRKVTEEEWLDVVDSLVIPGGLYHQPPYPGVIDAVNRLFDAGAYVNFVTARGFFAHADQIKSWTIEWVGKYFGCQAHLEFAQDKGAMALELEATHGIDDRIDNVHAMAKVGVQAYLMNQPHNLKEGWPENRRVDSVSQFVDRILANG